MPSHYGSGPIPEPISPVRDFTLGVERRRAQAEQVAMNAVRKAIASLGGQEDESAVPTSPDLRVGEGPPLPDLRQQQQPPPEPGGISSELAALAMRPIDSPRSQVTTLPGAPSAQGSLSWPGALPPPWAPAPAGGTTPSTLPGPVPGTRIPGGRLHAPLPGRAPTASEFMTPSAAGAPGPGGQRYHAGMDWFARAGTQVNSPVAGTIVEVEHSTDSEGKVYGGEVKIRDSRTGRIFVFRHVNPSKVKLGQTVKPGQRIASVAKWTGGSPHAHIEVWKTMAGGYNLGNMLDPAKVFASLR